MLSESEEKQCINQIRKGKQMIIEALQKAYEQSGGSLLTEKCENLECAKCHIHTELQKVKKLDCWSTNESLVNLTLK